MSGDREATSEQSLSVHEGADYKEVYLSGYEPMAQNLTWSSKGESSAHSLAKEEEEGDENECKQEEGEEEEDHGEGDRAVGEVEDDDHRPFIVPLIWTVDDFYPTMLLKVFNNLYNRF